MSKRVERMMKEYPQIIMEMRCLKNQIVKFKGISDVDLIESMQFSQPEGERVQNSNVSDKTAGITLSYEAKMDQINDDWLWHLIKKHASLQEEIDFFESALQSLSGCLPEMLIDMIMNGLTWEDTADKYHVSRTMVARHRKKAICELETLYSLRDQDLAAFILS